MFDGCEGFARQSTAAESRRSETKRSTELEHTLESMIRGNHVHDPLLLSATKTCWRKCTIRGKEDPASSLAHKEHVDHRVAHTKPQAVAPDDQSVQCDQSSRFSSNPSCMGGAEEHGKNMQMKQKDGEMSKVCVQTQYR